MGDPSVSATQLDFWLERMRSGDAAARDELFRGVYGGLERLARRMLQGFPNVQRWAEAEDVLHNALLRLLRSAGDVQPGSSRDFLGLAAEQIRRELLDLARHCLTVRDRAGGLGRPIQGQCSPAALDEVPEAADAPKDLEKWYAFHEEVANLPAAEREVVGLLFYHGWTQAAVAELFQVSVRTVRRRWDSALRKLCHRLNGNGPEA